MTHFAYILKCFYDNSTNIYYRGFTNDINRRFLEHKRGYEKFTKRFNGNISLIYLEEINDRNEKLERKKARRRELEIKKWSRSKVDNIIKRKRKKIQDLIHKHFEAFVF